MMSDLRGRARLVMHIVGNVALTAYNRLDVTLFTRLVKVNYPVHTTVVGYRHSGLSEVFYSPGELVNLTGAVQETVFGM